MIKVVSQAFSICYLLFRQPTITVSPPFSWASYFGIVLPDNILGNFQDLYSIHDKKWRFSPGYAKVSKYHIEE
jgi:hypothetical protein